MNWFSRRSLITVAALLAGATSWYGAAPLANAQSAPSTAKATNGPRRPFPERFGNLRSLKSLIAEDANNARKLGIERAVDAGMADDDSAYVGPGGQIAFVEPIPEKAPAEAPATNLQAQQISLNGTPANAFALHSRPGSSKRIFIDFDGSTTVAPSFWTAGTVVATPFDQDGSPSTFSANERQTIVNTWLAVAEDYAAFDVDVTTQQPTAAQLERTSAGDTEYGTTAVVTNNNWFCPGSCSGVAVVNSFGSLYTSPAWIFSTSTSSPQVLGFIVSHEVGHNLALIHDGSSTSTYYAGHGNWGFQARWVPIMGGGVITGNAVTQWSRGEYDGANNPQDDISIIASTLGYDSDPDGGLLASATVVPLSGYAWDSGDRTIINSSDVDYFAVDVPSGRLEVVASVSGFQPNLDLALSVFDSSGALLSISNPDATQAPLWSYTGPPGRFYMAVSGSGFLGPLLSGYSSYGSIGRYSLLFNSVPSAPPNPQLTPSLPGQLSASWQRPPEAGSTPLRYGVSLCPVSGGTCLGQTVTGTATIFSGLPIGSVWSMVVTALRPPGSSWVGVSTNALNATVVGSPSQPLITSFLPATPTVDLGWTASSPNASTIAYYEVETANITTGVVQTSFVAGLSTTYSGINATDSYSFRVRAVSNYFPSDWSAPAFIRRALRRPATNTGPGSSANRLPAPVAAGTSPGTRGPAPQSA
jgi:hypothetical protein